MVTMNTNSIIGLVVGVLIILILVFVLLRLA
jgi:tetrahydromethanopterin S-methyltransferase subunit F